MIRFQRAPTALSKVPGHEGPYIVTWLNTSRVPGLGSSKHFATGWFRLCKAVKIGKFSIPGVFWMYGPEFHGGAPYAQGGKVV